MDVLEVLRATREKVPASWGGLDGGSCVAQLLVETVGSHVISNAQRAVAHAIGLPDATNALYCWNDAEGRTHADVLAAFDRAIAVGEAKAAEFDTGASHALLAIAERETVAV